MSAAFGEQSRDNNRVAPYLSLRYVIRRQGPVLCKAREIHGSYNFGGKQAQAHINFHGDFRGRLGLLFSDHNVVGGIHENRLAQGKSDIARNDRRVHRGVEVRERRLGESSDEFLDVSDALRSRCGASRSFPIPERQVFSQSVKSHKAVR